MFRFHELPKRGHTVGALTHRFDWAGRAVSGDREGTGGKQTVRLCGRLSGGNVLVTLGQRAERKFVFLFRKKGPKTWVENRCVGSPLTARLLAGYRGDAKLLRNLEPRGDWRFFC